MVLERKPTNPEPPNAAALGGEEPKSPRANRQGAAQTHKRAKRPQGLRPRAMQAGAKFHFQDPTRASIIVRQRLKNTQKGPRPKVPPEPVSLGANGSVISRKVPLPKFPPSQDHGAPTAQKVPERENILPLHGENILSPRGENTSPPHGENILPPHGENVFQPAQSKVYQNGYFPKFTALV